MSQVQHTEIPMNDVFISWTGADRDLKNAVVEHLRNNNITVTESDHDCVGDFRSWSKEAVSRCTVFLCIITENTATSKYVPIEIEEFKKQNDWENRVLPVVSDFSVYEKEFPEFAGSSSAHLLDGRKVTDDDLTVILDKVKLIISNRLFKIYKEATKPTYLKIKSFLRMVHVQEREFDYKKLYVNRATLDEENNSINNASEFIKSGNIFFLQGAAGSGKSSYIDQLREAAGDDVIVISLACRKLTNKADLFKAMFDEFSRNSGNYHFYTEEGFRNLIFVKHVLLVLDGMDEIATRNGTRKFLDAVSDYYTAHASTTTLFFTSRNADDADIISMNGQIPKRFTLCPLEEEQIQKFGKNLFLLLEKPDKSDAFFKGIEKLADEIRTNPLLLSQLAIIYDKKDDIPQTTIGIYDTVCEITFSQEEKEKVSNIPERYQEMVTHDLRDILMEFSAERYRLISLDKQIETRRIFSAVMKKKGHADATERAEFLEEYLRDRAMIIDGEFYHKMLLEYFTAVYYCENAFNDYGELENTEKLKDLFSHYEEPYWSAVLSLFLVKADSLIDGKTTAELYETLLSCDITEYTLLFDACRDLICNKENAQKTLTADILQKSANGVYPPYGPLFWYVPEYDLYAVLISALCSIKENFTKALALTRDVCFIFGHYNTAYEITDSVDGKSLFAKAELFGVRRGLCQLFYTGATEEAGFDKIYPRCFNLAEAKNWKEYGCGVLGTMHTAFEDELGLYCHEMFSELGNEYIGIVSAVYDKEKLETVLPKKSCRKLCGLFLSGKEQLIKRLAINDNHLKMVYVPETAKNSYYRYYCVLNNEKLYFHNTVWIPEGVTRINDFAFSTCSSLKDINIPEGVTEIGEYSFLCCIALSEINIPKSVTKIGRFAFKYCGSLKSINIPKSVTKIGRSAFSYCISLEKITIPESVTEIGEGAFEYCSALKDINIPEGVTEIGWYIFSGCSSLEKINIPKNVTKIGNGAFRSCSTLEKITIPENVTEIGYFAFEYCSSLKSINISESVTYIGVSAFKGCSSLKNINIPESITYIEELAFGYCSSLKDINIPESITYIGELAFSYCSLILEITIPDSVTEIGKGAFEGCTALKLIENCPAGHTRQYLGVPETCEINFRDLFEETFFEVPQWTKKVDPKQFYGQCDLTEIIIPDRVTEIGEAAFKDCSCLKNITLPDSLTTIGDSAFCGCSVLTKINIPESVTVIEGGAFEDCQELTEITIPKGVTAIKDGTFSKCVALEKITILGSVTVIEEFAFNNCSSLKKINIPESVTKIGSAAFSGCSALKDINIPKNVTEIGDYAFSDCSALKDINIPENVIKIGWFAFSGCSALLEINIPESVMEIGKSAFSGCSSIKDITIPEKVTAIGESAFSDCSSLKDINIPEKVTAIEKAAFKGCSSLKEITIPEKVTAIEKAAFEGCASLTSIKVPEGVRFIGDGAFKDCVRLCEITISRRFEDDLSRIFENVDLSKVKIHWI